MRCRVRTRDRRDFSTMWDRRTTTNALQDVEDLMLRRPLAALFVPCCFLLCSSFGPGCASPDGASQTGVLAFDEGGDESLVSTPVIGVDGETEETSETGGTETGESGVLTACEQLSVLNDGGTLCEDWGETCVLSSLGAGDCENVCGGMGLVCLGAYAESSPCEALESEPLSCSTELDPGGVQCTCGPAGDVVRDDPPNPSPIGVNRIRIVTNVSPSWVAWFEVRVEGRPAADPAAPTLPLAIETSTGTSETPTEPAANAVDGDWSTPWNAGDFGPASLTLTFGEPVLLDSVRLLVAQNPPGLTTHVLEVESEGGNFEPLHVFHAVTQSGAWLEWTPDTVSMNPDPVQGCEGCLGSSADCGVACNGIGYDTGICAHPGSVDPAACCACWNDAIPFDGTGIFNPQRSPFYAYGELTVVGNRFQIEDEVYYPKTDFLTPVSPGTDIAHWNTLDYFAYAPAKRAIVREALVAHQYNNVYLYTLTEGVDFGGQGHPVTPYGDGGFSFNTNALNVGKINDWKAAIEDLLAHDIKPFLWLAGDDSATIASKPLSEWQTYVQHMVDAFEEYPIAWVIGLEADEYWSAAAVQARVADLKARTSHLVGVHLTPTETKNPSTAYKQGADFVLAQFTSPQTNAEYAAQIQAYNMAEVPWIASEFNVTGTGQGDEAESTVTARSNAIGKVIAEVGDPPIVAGLGNGIDLSFTPPVTGDPGLPFSLEEVTWLHVNVGDWPVTATLSSVSIEGGVICLDYDKSTAWPSVQIPHNSGNGTVDVVANPWVFTEYNGQWYAGTWEWLAVGSTCKNKTSVAGDHIKQPPLGPADWKPVSGQELYFMVSGLARFSNIANVSERSNIVKVVWP